MITFISTPKSDFSNSIQSFYLPALYRLKKFTIPIGCSWLLKTLTTIVIFNCLLNQGAAFTDIGCLKNSAIQQENTNHSFANSIISTMPPPNDICSMAQSLTVSNDICTSISSTNIDATDSGIQHGCANYQGGDVWFSFVAPLSGLVVINVENDTANVVNGIALYDGCNGQSIRCTSISNFVLFSNLVPGNTYVFAVWEFGNNKTGNFDICAYEPAPPVNDDCANAIALSVGIGACQDTITSDNIVASASGTPHNCVDYLGGDVWFSFVAPPTGSVVIDIKDYDGAADGLELFHGCGGPSLHCILIGNVVSFTGLISGDTYVFAIWELANDVIGVFDICMYERDSPVNDDCATATTLFVGDSDCEHIITSNNIGATDSGILPGCEDYQGGDIWFSFTAPHSGSIIIEISNDDFSVADAIEFFYECGGSSFLCVSIIDILVVTDLVPGDVYVFRIWESGNDSFESFDICLQDGNVLDCPEVKILEVPENGNTIHKSANQTGHISSQQHIGANAQVDYTSGYEIVLNPGFNVDSGADFTAYIEGCDPIASDGFIHNLPVTACSSFPAGEDPNNVANGIVTGFQSSNPMCFTVDTGTDYYYASGIGVTTSLEPFNSDPKAYTISGSNDNGVTYTEIVSSFISCTFNRNFTRRFNFTPSPTAYNHFKIEFTQNCGGSIYMNTAEVQLFGTLD